MKPWPCLLMVIGLLSGSALAAGAPLLAPYPPAFTHSADEDWLNSPPLNWMDLHGQVVLLEFWTFGCHNCSQSIPWLKAVERRYRARGLRIVSVHTPEFDFEKPHAAVQQKLRALGIGYPVMLDNDMSYWKAIGNRYWPAFYLVDREGRVRAFFAGETHAGDDRARAMESQIEALLGDQDEH